MKMESYVVLKKKKLPLEDYNELGFIFSTLSIETTMKMPTIFVYRHVCVNVCYHCFFEMKIVLVLSFLEIIVLLR
jgi:hypothetical protein